MNQLETLIIPTETVDFNGQPLTVRGFSLSDVTHIVRHHKEVTAKLYVEAIGGNLPGSIEEIVLYMLDDFAPLASMAVATALSSPGQTEKAALIPISVQAQILEKALELTFVGEDGLEKMMEIAARAMTGAASLTSPKA